MSEFYFSNLICINQVNYRVYEFKLTFSSIDLLSTLVVYILSVFPDCLIGVRARLFTDSRIASSLQTPRHLERNARLKLAPEDWKSPVPSTTPISQCDTILLNHIIKIFFGLTVWWAELYFVGAEGFEPTTYAGYQIYSPAPNQLEHYSHFIFARTENIEIPTPGFGIQCSAPELHPHFYLFLKL